MSDEEYERFEVTDFDLENEFNPNKGRRRPTKHQQIYGIWADDSEDEYEQESSNQHGRRGFKQKSKNYSEPVSFVSGGVEQSGKEKKVKDEKKSVDSDEEEQERMNARPMFSLKTTYSSESEEEPPSITSMAGFRTASSIRKTSTHQQGLGKWEAHTKGIGHKLLMQMGYEPGKGLGKKLQGISTPVQAHVRKGRGAIGAYGPELGQTLADTKKVIKVDEDEKEAIAFRESLNQWKKDTTGVANQAKNKKNRYFYKSVQDVIEKGKRTPMSLSDRLSSKLTNVTVIDMTGPEKRVLSGYHAIGQSRVASDAPVNDKKSNQKKSKKFELPELTHNLDLIVGECEKEIIAIDKKQCAVSTRKSELNKQFDKLEHLVELEENHIHTLGDVQELTEALTDPIEPLTLQRAEYIFLELQANYPDEYKQYGLADLAAGVIAPLFVERLKDWEPLKNPSEHTNVLKIWREILEVPDSKKEGNIFEPYSSLVWAGIMPSMRNAAATWDPRCHHEMVTLLDAWAPLFPNWVLDSVLEQVVLPRLNLFVQSWDPLTDTIPIHIWILPWAPLLGHRMKTHIYPTIRHKLGTALTAWMPSDRSARAMLTPWKGAFDEGDLQAFLTKHIIPKLQLALTKLIINPLQQDLEYWNQMWEWHELISPVAMVLLLDKFFFPRWIQTLVMWLNESPNLDQVSRWYVGWKNLFSTQLLQQPNIKEHFRAALEFMHRATSDGPVLIPEPPKPPSFPMAGPSRVAAQPPALMDLHIHAPQNLAFKDIISDKCAERGIIFAPMPGRREMGKQVYRVGKLFCYTDGNLAMVSDGTLQNWKPMHLHALIERAQSGLMI